MQSPVPTPYAVQCPCSTRGDDDLVFMTTEYYNKQMRSSNSTWCCPACGQEAYWSDINYESYFDVHEPEDSE